MPPKKKKGGKKKKAGAKSLKPIIPIDTKLPAMPDMKQQTLGFTVANSDISGFSRLVTHYDHGDVINAGDMNGSTVLHIATKKGDIAMVKRILQHPELDLNIREKRLVGGYTAIHHACIESNVEILELLLDAGGDPNIKADSDLGDTALHICCKMGRLSCAKILIAANASLDIRDNFGNNASFWAHSKQNDDLIRILGLPPPKAATADEYYKIMVARLPNFQIGAPAKKKSGKKGKDGDKKKGKK